MLGLIGSASCLLAIAVALTGCAVGPDFERPRAPDVPGYTPEALPGQTTATEPPTGRKLELAR